MLDSSKWRKVGAVAAIGQGLVTAAAPQMTARIGSKMLRQNYRNAGNLEARPRYLRQLRSVGIGVAAAGVASLILESAAEDSEGDGREQ